MFLLVVSLCTFFMIHSCSSSLTPQLIVSNYTQIHSLPLNIIDFNLTSTITTTTSSSPSPSEPINQSSYFENSTHLHSTNKSINSLDFHYTGNYLVWSDEEDNAIYVAPINSSEKNVLNINETEKLLAFVDAPRGLAIDWIHDLLYYIDVNSIYVMDIKLAVKNAGEDEFNPNINQTIKEQFKSEMSEENQGNLTESPDETLYDKKFECQNSSYFIHKINNDSNAYEIVVDPLESYLFWTTTEFEIMRAEQDGSSKLGIVSTDYSFSSSIGLDLDKKRVYWIDHGLIQMSSCDYNGENRVNLLKSCSHFDEYWSLDLFDGHIYWSHFRKKVLFQLNVKNDSSVKKTGDVKVILNSLSGLTALKVVHPSRQPSGLDKCAQSNCSIMCLPSGQTFTCVKSTTFDSTNETANSSSSESDPEEDKIIEKTGNLNGTKVLCTKNHSHEHDVNLTQFQSSDDNSDLERSEETFKTSSTMIPIDPNYYEIDSEENERHEDIDSKKFREEIQGPGYVINESDEDINFDGESGNLKIKINFSNVILEIQLNGNGDSNHRDNHDYGDGDGHGIYYKTLIEKEEDKKKDNQDNHHVPDG